MKIKKLIFHKKKKNTALLSSCQFHQHWGIDLGIAINQKLSTWLNLKTVNQRSFKINFYTFHDILF